MIKFEKVSYGQFKKDALNILGALDDDAIRKMYAEIRLPQRGTTGSAGYDFSSPISAHLGEDHESVLIPTGIRAQMPQDVALSMYPRSGLGFKTGTYLANTIGVIDSDYYYSDNEGHIMIKLIRGFKDLDIKPGDRIAQGIFMHYLTTEDDNATGSRNGGFGSTGK